MGKAKAQTPETPKPEAQNKPAETPTSSTSSQAPIESTEGLQVAESGSLLAMFRYFADTSTDDAEKAILLELIDLLEANPDQEDEFIKLLIQEMATQAKAALAKTEVEELDERTIRLRAAAQAELDTLYAGSKVRQEKAEAEAAEAQPDRRTKK